MASARASAPPAANGSAARTAEKPPISIRNRMLICFFLTIFGLVFFYLVMVFLSSIGTGITLERMESHGWARSASRFTAITTAPVLTLFMLSSPAKRWSLFFAVLAACAQFCHFVIISSDLSIYVDSEMAKRIFRTDAHLHPLLSKLPLYTTHVVGTIGFFAFLVITTERCFGSYLRYRKPTLPASSRWSASYITGVYTLWLSDHAIRAVFDAKALPQDKAYPFVFLLPLWYGMGVMWGRLRK